jgi:hypothetical protein
LARPEINYGAPSLSTSSTSDLFSSASVNSSSINDDPANSSAGDKLSNGGGTSPLKSNVDPDVTGDKPEPTENDGLSSDGGKHPVPNDSLNNEAPVESSAGVTTNAAAAAVMAAADTVQTPKLQVALMTAEEKRHFNDFWTDEFNRLSSAKESQSGYAAESEKSTLVDSQSLSSLQVSSYFAITKTNSNNCFLTSLHTSKAKFSDAPRLKITYESDTSINRHTVVFTQFSDDSSKSASLKTIVNVDTNESEKVMIKKSRQSPTMEYKIYDLDLDLRELYDGRFHMRLPISVPATIKLAHWLKTIFDGQHEVCDSYQTPMVVKTDCVKGLTAVIFMAFAEEGKSIITRITYNNLMVVMLCYADTQNWETGATNRVMSTLRMILPLKHSLCRPHVIRAVRERMVSSKNEKEVKD